MSSNEIKSVVRLKLITQVLNDTDIKAESILEELVSELVSSAAQAAVLDIKHSRMPCLKCSTK